MAEKEKTDEKSEGLGISGFTLAILSILTLSYGGAVISILGGVFCFIQQKKHKTKLGKAGLILAVIGLVLSLVYIKWIAPWISNYLQSASA